MKRSIPILSVVVTALIALAALARSPELRGVWTAEAGPDTLQLNVWRSHSRMNGHPMDLSSFTGLSEAQIAAVSETPVHFTLAREAGTIAFEGTFKQREGSGHFTFTPNDNFLDSVKALGVPVDDATREDKLEDRLFDYAIHDVSTAFIREMQAAGYRVPLERYVSMRIFRVTPALVTELRQLGYADIPSDDLVAMQIHRVTPQYIRDMRAAGFDHLSVEQLVASRIHGVTPEFITKLRAAGYTGLSMDNLIAFRIHGVSPEYLQDLQKLGYTHISSDDLVAFRIHGVSADYLRDLQALGYKDLHPDDLVAMRIHGVTAKFIRDLKDAGYASIPVEKLVEMRIHGLDARYMKKMNGDH